MAEEWIKGDGGSGFLGMYGLKALKPYVTKNLADRVKGYLASRTWDGCILNRSKLCLLTIYDKYKM